MQYSSFYTPLLLWATPKVKESVINVANTKIKRLFIAAVCFLNKYLFYIT